jgi:GT2 family glycosyltransferase
MKQVNTAILIPTRDRPRILGVTLEGLQKAGMSGIPIWIYDDFSEDPTAIKRVVSSFPNTRLVRGEKRVGQAEGRNILMRQCASEYGLLLDDDSFPNNSDWLENATQSMPGSNRVAITSFQYRAMSDGSLSLPAGTRPGFATAFLGGASLLHIPSILEVGGFRSGFIFGYEEPELALRLWVRGYRIWCDPSVLVNHNQFYCAEERRDTREYDYLYARNSILMSSLNMPLWYGLPHGLARSVRRSFYFRRNWRSKLEGTLVGLCQSFTLWRQRTPCSFGQAIEWTRLKQYSQ